MLKFPNGGAIVPPGVLRLLLLLLRMMAVMLRERRGRRRLRLQNALERRILADEVHGRSNGSGGRLTCVRLRFRRRTTTVSGRSEIRRSRPPSAGCRAHSRSPRTSIAARQCWAKSPKWRFDLNRGAIESPLDSICPMRQIRFESTRCDRDSGFYLKFVVIRFEIATNCKSQCTARLITKTVEVQPHE